MRLVRLGLKTKSSGDNETQQHSLRFLFRSKVSSLTRWSAIRVLLSKHPCKALIVPVLARRLLNASSDCDIYSVQTMEFKLLGSHGSCMYKNGAASV